jgi:hypothetical protein
VAAWERIRHWRVVPVLGDLAKSVTGKAKLRGCFAAAAVGHRHVHLAGPRTLQAAVAPGGLLMVEGAKYLLQLKKEQSAAFSGKIVEVASPAGWRSAGEQQGLRAGGARRAPCSPTAPAAWRRRQQRPSRRWRRRRQSLPRPPPTSRQRRAAPAPAGGEAAAGGATEAAAGARRRRLAATGGC